jgi:hypothetical protein
MANEDVFFFFKTNFFFKLFVFSHNTKLLLMTSRSNLVICCILPATPFKSVILNTTNPESHTFKLSSKKVNLKFTRWTHMVSSVFHSLSCPFNKLCIHLTFTKFPVLYTYERDVLFMDPYWSINGWKGLSSSVTQRQDIGGEAVKMKERGKNL